ncbi:MAG: DUF4091 domain-containing protein [Angelakisella sp.]
MQLSIFSQAEWTFPDTPLGEQTTGELELPRGGHGGFQLLGGRLSAGTVVTAQVVWEKPSEQTPAPTAELFELLSVGVNENTDSTLMTTTDYSRCRDFVTRQAPFRVYDALRPLDGAAVRGERLALYCRLTAPPELPAGSYRGVLRVTAGAETAVVALRCGVHQAVVPPVGKGRLGMVNFCYYENIAKQHGVAGDSPAYWELFRRYVAIQLELRCTHIVLPAGEPVRDSAGAIVGFDFTRAEHAGKIAIEAGAPCLCGPSVAHWQGGGDETVYYLQWEKTTSTLSLQGYLQLKLYFTAWAQVVERNGWQQRIAQSLADEPQVYNDTTYRALAAVLRKFLPYALILEAVETVNLGGGIDVWVPKQDTFEKERKAYTQLMEAGETMWFYTCAFPAGKIMNRSMDLPLTACRAVLWMGFGYGLSGFLHWGLNYYIGDDLWNSACCPHKGKLLPAGDAHLVYPDGKQVLPSMRLEQQRNGAEDYELLTQLAERDPQLATALQRQVCTSFRDYLTDGRQFEAVHAALLAALD